MKKILAFALAVLMLLSVSVFALADEGESDMAYVQDKGVLVVGITEFDPMDYKDQDGQWIGFDADMAKAFAESLGVDVEFVEIEWDNKVLELESQNIDVVWNGMTLNDEVMEAMECSNAYCNNAQTVILPADVAADYETAEDMADLLFAVEAGSAGEDQVEALGYDFTEVPTQADALLEVSAGTSDAAVIDLLMAAAMVGEGTGYEDLVNTVNLNSEEYGVGFRKGSDLAAALNDFFLESYEDGTMLEIAETYGVQASLIDQSGGGSPAEAEADTETDDAAADEAAAQVVYDSDAVTVTYDSCAYYDMGGENNFSFYFNIDNRTDSDVTVSWVDFTLDGYSIPYGYDQVTVPAQTQSTESFGYADHDYQGEPAYDQWLAGVEANGLSTLTVSFNITDASGSVLAEATPPVDIAL